MARTLVRGGMVVDGTGAPARRADVLVDGDRIVAVGEGGAADEVVDVEGLVVAPGFLDVHTHYDAQLCWDRLASPSPLHGVTTVVIGNCSLSLAPVDEDGRGKLVAMFEQIEDIRAREFEAGVPWNWVTPGEYLRAVSVGLGPNVAALVGHSTLRHHVMKAASQQRAATGEEVAEMARLLRDAMREGACGLSYSWLDVDEDLKPAPSRWSTAEERMALARAVSEGGGRVLQGVPNFMDLRQQVASIQEMAAISRETGLMATFGPVVDVPQVPALVAQTVRTLEAEAARGARIWGQTCPRPFDLNVRLDGASFILFVLPTWMEVMRRSVEERLAAFSDPRLRPRLIFEGMLIAPLLEFATVGEVHSEENAPLLGRRLVEIARERNCMLPQALLDVAIADGLRTEFRIHGAWHADEDAVARLMAHPRMLVGVSDAGAHYAQFCGAGDTTWLLQRFARERGDFTLEAAIRRITLDLAQAYGIADRGCVREGAYADLSVVDPATVERGPETRVNDLPGGGERYFHQPRGVPHVMVNGRWLVRDGAFTEERPGRVV